MLTTKQRAQLRALANPLADTLIIGKEGVTDAVERQLDQLLEAHELVKGKVLEARRSPRARCPKRCARRPAPNRCSASARNLSSTARRGTRISGRSCWSNENGHTRRDVQPAAPGSPRTRRALPGKRWGWIRCCSSRPISRRTKRCRRTPRPWPTAVKWCACCWRIPLGHGWTRWRWRAAARAIRSIRCARCMRGASVRFT